MLQNFVGCVFKISQNVSKNFLLFHNLFQFKMDLDYLLLLFNNCSIIKRTRGSKNVGLNLKNRPVKKSTHARRPSLSFK